MPSTKVASAVGVVTFLYVCLVRSLRWKRYNKIHKKYQAKYESRTLSPDEAQEVMQVGIFYDMPLLMNYSLAFALFKTYGIPSISGLLAKTGELGSRARIAKRYADTEILISTWALCPISGFYGKSECGGSRSSTEPDPRAMIAVARVNWLHAHYKISNDDYLYTLSLFIFEPIRWAARYGWRPLSPLESYAIFHFWCEIGRKMDIKNIPNTMEELEAWSLAYEATNMVPAQVNKDVATHTTEELLFGCPEAFGIKNFLRNLTVCLLEDRVRIAMLQPSQPWYYHTIIRATLASAAFFHKWLCLPRTQPKTVIPHPLKPHQGSRPRMRPSWWMSRPWYKPESTGLVYLLDRAKVSLGLYDEMPGPQLRSAGYRLEEMGPLHFENHGKEEVMQQAAQFLGCPVTGPWSLEKRE